MSPPLDGFAIEDLDVDSRGWIYATISSDVWISKDTLISWTLFYEGLANSVAVDDTTIYISDFSRGLFVTTDGVSVSQYLTDIDIRTFEISMTDQSWIAGGGAGQLFRSEDNGLSWTLFNGEQLSLSDEYIDNIASNSASIIYTTREVPRRGVGVSDGFFSVIEGYELEGLQYAEGRFFAFDSFDIVVSDDGFSWQILSDPESASVLTGLLASDGLLITSDFQGVLLKSSDGGQSWSDISQGLSEDPDAMILDDSGFLLAAVGNQVFRTTDPIVTTSGVPVEDFTEIPVATSIVFKSIYPNPARGSQAIEIVVTKPGHVTLQVFDAAGRMVSELLDSWTSPQAITFNWKPQSAGVYFFKAEIDGEVFTKSLVHLK